MKKRLRPVIFVIIIAGLAGLWYGVFREKEQDGRLVASGTVEATESQLGFLSPGRLESITVREGDAVTAGQQLAFLDRAEAQAGYRQAQAQVDAARAVLTELESGTRKEELAQAGAARDAANEKSVDALRDLKKAERLFEGGAISREALDKAKTSYDVSNNQLIQAEEMLRQLETGPRLEKIEAQKAILAQAEAGVAAAEAVLANMIIRAPFAGIVSIRHREPGESVPAGSPVVTLQDPEDRWVRIFVPEQRIGAVHLGSQATITTDTFRDREYSGEVTFISTKAEFTPKIVQTTEERVRLVYAVKVRITGDQAHDLKPGMPADVELVLST